MAKDRLSDFVSHNNDLETFNDQIRIQTVFPLNPIAFDFQMDRLKYSYRSLTSVLVHCTH